MKTREPGQVRKEAALSGHLQAPREHRTGVAIRWPRLGYRLRRRVHGPPFSPAARRPGAAGAAGSRANRAAPLDSTSRVYRPVALPPPPPAHLRRRRRSGARRPHAPQRRRAGAGPPRVPVRRVARHRQDEHGEDPRRLPELRRRPDHRRPCGKCDSCVSIANATSLDVIEMDAASNNSVDDIRDLREKVAYAPVSGRHKVYILDEAHMLSPQAWNAFLKTLEEPPPRTIFVLATTEAQKVLPTVVDRCHRFDFGRPTVEQVATVLERVAGEEGIDDREGRAGADRAPRHRQLPRRARDARAARHLRRRPRDRARRRARRARGRRRRAAVRRRRRDHRPRSRPARCARRRGSPTPAATPASCSATSRSTAASCSRSRCSATSRPSSRSPPSATSASPSRPPRCPTPTPSGCSTWSRRALDATANGAQARIQLELVLVKAAAPELDPSMSALLARIERLEDGPARPGGGLRAAPAARTAPTAERTDPPGDLRSRRPSPSLPRNPRRRRRSISTRPPPAGRRSSTWCAARTRCSAALLSDARPVAVDERS